MSLPKNLPGLRPQNSRGLRKAPGHRHLRRCHPARILCCERVRVTRQVVKLLAELPQRGIPRGIGEPASK